jgi:hypothetical protein
LRDLRTEHSVFSYFIKKYGMTPLFCGDSLGSEY